MDGTHESEMSIDGSSETPAQTSASSIVCYLLLVTEDTTNTLSLAGVYQHQVIRHQAHKTFKVLPEASASSVLGTGDSSRKWLMAKLQGMVTTARAHLPLIVQMFW